MKLSTILLVKVLATCWYVARARDILDPSTFTDNACGTYIASNYTTFTHIKTNKILSSTGVASDRFTKKNVFQLLQYYNFPIGGIIKDPWATGVAFYTKPWFNNSETQLYALDIEFGCNKNTEVKQYSASQLAKNKLFIINEDGSIGTTCNPEKDGEWRLVVDENGRQVMKDINEVSKEDLYWKTGTFTTTFFVPD